MEDRYTNTPEDAARFEQRRSDGYADDDRPSAAELAADEADERRAQTGAYDAVIRATYPAEPAVHTITIGDRLDGVYVFADYDDAQAFLAAVESDGRSATYDEQIVIDRDQARRVIADEAAG
jgi:hypothetical protein